MVQITSPPPPLQDMQRMLAHVNIGPDKVLRRFVEPPNKLHHVLRWWEIELEDRIWLGNDCPVRASYPIGHSLENAGGGDLGREAIGGSFCRWGVHVGDLGELSVDADDGSGVVGDSCGSDFGGYLQSHG